MARITGSDGSCTVADHNILFNTWSATFSQVITDLTAFGDSFAQKRGGVMSGTFSASGIMQKDGTPNKPMPVDDSGVLLFDPAGESVDLKASSTTDSMWSGTAIIGNVSPTSTMGGDASISVDGEFAGGITLTWDES